LRSHLDVERYVHPRGVRTWREVAEAELGFPYCASGAMVRSSYRADELFVEALRQEGASLAEARRRAGAANGT
jgi:lipoic acid synthetase